MKETADVVVVGAGAVGSACAYHLAEAGLKVVLLEREAVGSGASTHATGSLTMLSPDFKTEEHLRLAIESYWITQKLVPALEELTGVNILYQVRPFLRPALEEDEEMLIRAEIESQGKLAPTRWISSDEVRHIDPRLNPDFRGAAYQQQAAQLDSARFTMALAMGAERRGAALLLRPAMGLVREGDRVTGVAYRGGKLSSAAVVLAMGPWSALASRWLGFNVPVRPLKGEKLYLRLPGPPLPVLLNSPRRGHMLTRRDGFLSVGSTAGRQMDDQEQYVIDQTGEVGFHVEPTGAALRELLERAVELVPAVEDAEVAQQLAGVRPMSPDRMPMIGPVPGCPGAYLATGHTTRGIHLAAVTGRVIADLVARGRTDLPVSLRAFDPARFESCSDHPMSVPRFLDD